MPKSILLLSLALLTSLISFSQPLSSFRQDYAEVNWGPEEEARRNQNLFRVLGHTTDSYYALIERKRLANREYSLRRFDKQMELQASADIILSQNGNQFSLLEVLMVDGRIWQFDAYKNLGSKEVIVHAIELDNRTLKPIGNRKRIASYNGGGIQSLNPIERESRRDESLIISTSQNQQFIALQANSRTKKKEQESSKIVVFDSDLQLVWEEDVKLPSTERQFVMQELDIDNAGNVYLLGRHFNNGEGRRVRMSDGRPNYDYRILKITAGASGNTDFELDLGDKFITDLTLSTSQDNILNCAGFYSERGGDKIAGTCFLSLDAASGNAIIRNTKAFSLEFLMQNESARKQKRIQRRDEKGKSNELRQIDLRELISLEGGGAYLIGEERYETEQTYSDGNGNVRSTTLYHYDDLIVVRLSPEGIIEWAQKIPKRQTGGIIPFYFSYSTAVVDEELFIIYNDAEENLLPRDPDRPRTFSTDLNRKDNVVTIAKVDKSGIERKMLFRRAETGVLLRAALAKQIEPDKVLVFGELKKTHRFGLLEFK